MANRGKHIAHREDEGLHIRYSIIVYISGRTWSFWIYATTSQHKQNMNKREKSLMVWNSRILAQSCEVKVLFAFLDFCSLPAALCTFLLQALPPVLICTFHNLASTCSHLTPFPYLISSSHLSLPPSFPVDV